MTPAKRTNPTLARTRHHALTLAAALLLPLMGCQESYPADDESATPAEEPAAAPQETWEALGDSLAESITEMPADSAARTVISYLEGAEYRDRWTHWPDRQPYYTGAEPHGMLLSTYMNDRAAATLARLMEGTEDHLPMGSFVVKENHQPDSTLVAVTVMVKAGQGYDPDHNDWFWLKYTPAPDSAGPSQADVEAAGVVDSCIACHGDAQEMDFLRTAQAGQTAMEGGQ